ncbi:MAG: TonB-dependent receptor [Candidatus Marinimicrobia bacterium]|nr:TonB-dependent receptor [Candidatus Neomarinimicrobiota bacterium]
MKKSRIMVLIGILIMSLPLLAGSVSGFISNLEDGEPIHYANVFLENTTLGAVSNADGYYIILDVPDDTYTLTVSVIGYKLEKRDINVAATARVKVHFDLIPEQIELEEVIVTAEREKFRQEIKISSITLNQTQLRTVPVLIEADLFRALQMLPSVSTGSDFSSALYVRGGSPDQNLILLDGITVYNPYHFGGIFSTFNTDAIKEAEFIAGGFPAEYGGRMSSILDIKNREGNSEEFHGSGNVSLLSSKLLLEGPIPHGSFMISGRRTYFDAIWEAARQGYNLFADYPFDVSFPYYFYDFQGKVNVDINDQHRTTLSGFYGNDVLWFKEEFKEGNPGEDGYRLDYYGVDWTWGNNTTSLKHRWLVRPDLIAKFFVARSHFHFDVDFLIKNEYYNINGEDTTDFKSHQALKIYDYITDWSEGLDMTWLINKKNTMKFGVFHKDIDFSLGADLNELSLLDSVNHSREWGFYVQNKYRPSPLFIFEPGLRMTRYTNTKKWYPDLRIKGKILATDKLAFTLAGGTVYQFLQTANFENELVRFIDLWFPTTSEQEPSKATHFNAGLEYWHNNIQFTLEGYYKKYDHLLTMSEDIGGATLMSFIEAEGYSYGIEFLVKKTTGDLTGWVGYSYMSTKKRESEAGGWYPPKYDRTHSLNVVAKYDIDKRWFFSSSLVWSTGNPYSQIYGNFHYTNPLSEWSYIDRMEIYGERNGERYPPYFRWDIGVNRRGKLFKQKATYYFHVLNVTNHANVFLYLYEKRDAEFDPETNTSVIYRRPVTMFPILPTFGVEFSF